MKVEETVKTRFCYGNYGEQRLVDKFIVKSLLYNIKFTREAANADKKAARKCISTFSNINEDETYSSC